MVKKCYICKTKKELSEFSPQRNGHLGRYAYCKNCYNAYRRTDEKLNEKRRQYALKRYHKIKKSPHVLLQRRLYHVKYHYNLTPEEYEWLFNLRNVCWLCGDNVEKKNIDHDHSHHPENSGIGCKACIRGLLCDSCNWYLLPGIERHPHLQNDFIKAYLNGRPFKDFINGTTNPS